jgi:hypothetical protein
MGVSSVQAGSLALHELFQFRGDQELFRFGIVRDFQDVGLAADLAVFDVALRTAGGLVHRGFVPLTATGALESWGHPPYSRACTFLETKLMKKPLSLVLSPAAPGSFDSVRLRLTALKMTG